MRISGRRLFERRHDGGEFPLDDQHLGRGVAEDEHLLRHRQPPVQRQQQGAKPRAGIKQHQIIRMIEREDRDAVAAADAKLRLQRARGLRDAFVQCGVGDRAPFEAQRRLIGHEGGVARDEVGEVHGEILNPLPRLRGRTASEASRVGAALRSTPPGAATAAPPSPFRGEIRRALTHPSRPARRAPRGRCGRCRFPRSTAASANRNGCRDRCARAAGSSASPARRRCGSP